LSRTEPYKESGCDMKRIGILVAGLLAVFGGLFLNARYERMKETAKGYSRTIGSLKAEISGLEADLSKSRMETAAERETMRKILAKVGPVAFAEARAVWVFGADGQRSEYRGLKACFESTREWAPTMGKGATSDFLRTMVVTRQIEGEYDVGSVDMGYRFLIKNTGKWSPYVDRASRLEILENAIFREPDFAASNKGLWETSLSGPEKAKMAELIERGRMHARRVDVDYPVPHLPAPGVLPYPGRRGGLGRY